MIDAGGDLPTLHGMTMNPASPNLASPTLSRESSIPSRRFVLADFAPLISLAALIFVFAMLVENFVSLGTVTLVLKRGAVLAIVATGLTFVLLCAEIDLSVGMLALLAACLCGVLWEQPFAAGPKGMGVLVRSRRAIVGSTLFGGGQESGLRPGTENVAGIVGASVALQEAQKDFKVRAEKVAKVRDSVVGW